MRIIGHLRRGEAGSSLVELAAVLPFFMLILVAAIDLSRAFYLGMEVAGASHAAAQYGIQNPTDTAGITAAAKSDAPDVSNLVVSSPTQGCECSDGGSSSTNCATTPTCTYNVVYWVTVRTSVTYKPIFPWPGIPSTITLANSATMRSGS